MLSRKNYLIVLLQCMVVRIHIVFDWIVDFFFYIYYHNQENKHFLPPVDNPLLLESVFDLAENIRKKKVSAEYVVRTFINRCKQINSLLNVIVDERYTNAIDEAKMIDQFLSTAGNEDLMKLQSKQPLLGVPFTTKESNEVKGLLHSMGMLVRQNYRSKEDATTIKLLKNAGAIVIAKTNIPELNLWVESRNLIYGQSNNPYNITRTAGGSSGGDAATVAACGAPFALGSDIGGSIRLPAFFNGVFGFKPSFTRQKELEDHMKNLTLTSSPKFILKNSPKDSPKFSHLPQCDPKRRSRSRSRSLYYSKERNHGLSHRSSREHNRHGRSRSLRSQTPHRFPSSRRFHTRDRPALPRRSRTCQRSLLSHRSQTRHRSPLFHRSQTPHHLQASHGPQTPHHLQASHGPQTHQRSTPSHRSQSRERSLLSCRSQTPDHPRTFQRSQLADPHGRSKSRRHSQSLEADNNVIAKIQN